MSAKRISEGVVGGPLPKLSTSDWKPPINEVSIREFITDLGELFLELNVGTLKLPDATVVTEVRSHRAVRLSPESAPVPLSRLIVDEDGAFTFEVLCGGLIESGTCTWTDLQILKPYLNRMLSHEKSNFKFCPGILSFDEQFGDKIRFPPSKLRRWGFPSKRCDSTTCKVLFELGRSARMESRVLESVVCPDCKRFEKELNSLKKTAMERSPADNLQRTAASFNTPLKYLSPSSRSAHLSSSREKRWNLTRSLAKYEHLAITLSEKQSGELSQACKTIEHDFPHELQTVMTGNEGQDESREALQDAWESDKAAWTHDQARNENGSHGNRWSMLTYRVALAVFTRSTAAYEALQGFGILNLPSVRSLKHITSAYIEKPGRCEGSIQYQKERYDALKLEKAKEATPPIGEGILIFDEVKVISKVLWNSRSEEMYGLAMTDADMSSLGDVFSELSEKKVERTEYALQFIWRDMTAKFDVYGPYFTSQSSLDSKFTLPCLLDTLRLLHNFGFKSNAVVCDGAATNMSLIKSMMGVRGSFGHKAPETADRHTVPSSICHPFWPKQRLYFIICPSHQLKNMINALNSSRSRNTRGTKDFQSSSGTSFGWKCIHDLYEREVSRMKQCVPREVPKLRKNFVLRDAWTKLNVLPAKVMQQDEVLTELAQYLLTPHPDNPLVEASHQYLSACNLMFEMGTLSHIPVKGPDSEPLLCIVEGFMFFEDWINSLIARHPSLRAY